MKQSLLFLLALATVLFVPKHVAATAHNVFALRVSKDGDKLANGDPNPLNKDHHAVTAVSVAPPAHVPSDAPSLVPSDAPSSLPSDLPSVVVPKTSKCREPKRSQKGKKSKDKQERVGAKEECGEDKSSIIHESAEDALNASSSAVSNGMTMAVTAMAAGWILV
jgi:hypothetical protein